jgi:hypothetical protein
VTNNVQWIEVSTRAHPGSAAPSTTRGETPAMLAPLAVFLLILLITCSLTLLIIWAYDKIGADIEAGPSCPAVLEIPVHPHGKRFAPVCATLNQSPGGRARSVVIQRAATQSLGSKRSSRRLRKIGIIRSPRRFDNAAPEQSHVDEE